MTIDVDDLFSKIDKLSANIKPAPQSTQKSGSGTRTNNFKNLDMVFLDGISGSYELKIILDGNGNLSEDIYTHNIPTGGKGAKGTSVTCKGEGCELCDRYHKIDKMKRKDSWIYAPRKQNKILVKIGDLPAGKAGQLEAGKVYVAYVDDKYLLNLMDSISLNKKYYKDDLAKMFNASQTSAGFLVSVSHQKRSSNYNFSFIPTMSIAGINITETFGIEKFDVKNFGYYRSNYIPKDKFDKALSYLDFLIVNATKIEAPPADSDKQEESKPEEKAESDSKPTETTNDQKDPPFDPDLVKTESASTEQATTAEAVKSETVINTSELVRSSTDLGSDGKPKCSSYFAPTEAVCSGCSHKKACLMETIAAERL